MILKPWVARKDGSHVLSVGSLSLKNNGAFKHGTGGDLEDIFWSILSRLLLPAMSVDDSKVEIKRGDHLQQQSEVAFVTCCFDP